MTPERCIPGLSGFPCQPNTPLFDEALDDDVIGELRATTNGGWAIGGERCKERIAAQFRGQVSPLRPGRPPNRVDRDNQPDLLRKTHSDPECSGHRNQRHHASVHCRARAPAALSGG